MFSRTKSLAVVALALGAGMLAACTSGAAPSAPATPSASADAGVAAVHATLPQEIKDKGVIKIGYQNNAGLPYGVVGEDGKDQGLNVDIANKLGEVLGIKVELAGGDFASLIPGLQSKRYDLVTNITTDTAERREVVDFVDVMYGEPSSLVVKKGSENAGKTLATACGLRIAVNVGSTQEKRTTTQSEECVKAGEAPIEISAFPGIPDMLLALTSNRVDAVYLSMGASRYLASHDDTVELGRSAGALHELNGLMTIKGNPLAESVRAAMLHLNSTGEWRTMLDGYGLGDLAVSDEVMNNLDADYTALLDKANAERPAPANG